MSIRRKTAECDDPPKLNLAYMIFDQIYLDGTLLVGEPYTQRRERLGGGPSVKGIPAGRAGRAPRKAATGTE